MPIKFSVQPNPVAPGPNDQSARVSTNATLTEEDIIKECLRRGTTLTEPDLRATLTLLFTVITDKVADGNSVVTRLANIRPSITGAFNSATDTFDSARHTKRATLSAGTMLYDKMQQAKVEKISVGIPSPDLLQFLNVKSGTTNDLLTPGSIGQLVGSELKFNPANAEEGIYLTHETGTETKVTELAIRTEKKLLFTIPAALATGGYRIEVRKGYGKTATIRTGLLHEQLQIV